MKKRFLALLIICAILVPALATISANAVSPRLSYITDICAGLSVLGTTATYTIDVTGTSTVTSISATLQLQKLSGSTWSNYGSAWSASASSDTLYKSGTKSVASGGTYRLKVVVTASAPTGSGSATAYSA